MDFESILARLEILAEAARYDASCASSGGKRPSGSGLGSTPAAGICHSTTPDGRCVSLLKILLTNTCIYDCRYCINRASSNIPRARLTPEEVVWLTLEFYRRNFIEGLFLSSGIVRNADHTMERMIRVARTLRQEHQFEGYIHLKAVPGASLVAILEAGRWADRLSANIEMPLQEDLDRYAPAKTIDEAEGIMSWIHQHRLDWMDQGSPGHMRFTPAGQSTQMVVGATETPDSAVLETARRLYGRHHLRRVYYSAFSPIPDADPTLPTTSPPLVREHRLYQADWLMRHYGFDVHEIVAPGSNLDLDIDPKLAWALRHRDRFPVDINRASQEELLRVPGFGRQTVQRIVRIRRMRSVTLSDLHKMRAVVRRARPFIITGDGGGRGHAGARALDRLDLRRRLGPARGSSTWTERSEPEQLSLFEAKAEARSGEL